MSKHHPSNIPASIKGRLLQLSKQQREEFNYLLTRFAADRLLYRLSQSPYKQQFILKGASLFRIWNGEPHRATKDLDLLSYGENGIFYLEKVFKDICCIPFENDGIIFEHETVKVDTPHT